MPTTATPLPPGLEELGRRPPLRRYLADIWARREFAFVVAEGQLRAQNQNTLLGNLWHLLNPLLLAAVYYFIFGVVLGGNNREDNYPAFLIIGLFVFHFTQKLTLAGTGSIVGNQSLIRNIRFPRALLPIALVSQETVGQLFTIGSMFALAWLTGERPRVTWLLIIPLLVLQIVMNFGLALVTARMTFHFRDVEKLLPYLMRIWFYCSGVFFGADLVFDRAGETAGRIFELNPAYPFIHLARLAVMDGTTDGRFWLIAGAWSIVALIGGVAYFRRSEHEYGLA
ncbi:MAG: ABC transporter permease [Actinomycetes bacterium]